MDNRDVNKLREVLRKINELHELILENESIMPSQEGELYQNVDGLMGLKMDIENFLNSED